jgi:AcrR family transcriptional regulator
MEGCAKRADARRNRAQVLQAAEVEFAENGIGVPIDEIARKAGVGVGTVYRHFPTKESLVEAVVITRMEQLAEEAADLTKSDDPGGAFFGFLFRMAEQASAKRDLVEALLGAGVDLKEASAGVKDKVEEAAQVLLRRAQQAGCVRTDVELADLFGLVMGTCAYKDHEPQGCSQARMLSVVFDGLRPSGPSSSEASNAGNSQSSPSRASLRH